MLTPAELQMLSEINKRDADVATLNAAVPSF